MTTLTPSRLAEIEARIALINDPNFIGRSEIGEHVRLHDIPALLASHAALSAEVERLKQNTRESDLVRLARPPAPDGNGTTVGTQSVARLIQRVNEYACYDEQLRQLMREVAASLTTAREAGAREMREALERIVNSPTIKSVCGWYDEIEAARKLLSALPLTTADGAKDE